MAVAGPRQSHPSNHCLSRRRSQSQKCTATVGEPSNGVSGAGNVLYGSVCGLRMRDSSGSPQSDHEESPAHQSHRALQQYATPACCPPGTRDTGVLQEVRESRRRNSVFHLPLQPDESSSITCITLPKKGVLWPNSSGRMSSSTRKH